MHLLRAGANMSRVRAVTRAVTNDEIAVLFTSDVAGDFWDLTQQSSLYQDASGTTPVSVAGDPVGLAKGLRSDGGANVDLKQSTTSDKPIWWNGYTRTSGNTCRLVSPNSNDPLIGFSADDHQGVIIQSVEKNLQGTTGESGFFLGGGQASEDLGAKVDWLGGPSPLAVGYYKDFTVQGGASSLASRAAIRTQAFHTDINGSIYRSRGDLYVNGSFIGSTSIGAISSYSMRLELPGDPTNPDATRAYRAFYINRVLTAAELDLVERWVRGD